jgi:outer membrane protein TolC
MSSAKSEAVRTRRLGLTVALALLAPILASGQAAGQTTPPPAAAGRTVTLTLEDSLRAALQRAPEVRGAAAEVEGILGKELQAQGLGYPQAQLTAVLGPSPRARGDQVSSPDKKYELNITGIFVRADVAIIQPIFTWGLIDNARQAAKHGVRATEAGVDVKSTEVALKVKQAYWGLVTATAIRDFLLELSEQVDRTVDRTERLIEGGFTTESDVYRLRANKGELDKNLHLVEKLRDLARAALAAWTGQPAGTTVEAADKVLPAELGDPRALELYLEDARGKRPEFTQLREGIQARQHLVEVERKQRYPLFFVGVVGAAAYATNRDRIDNPFIYDPLNDAFIGPVIGFKYSLDFGIAAGKIKEAEAEVHKLEALRQYAEEGIPLQVRDAYGTVVEAQRNAKALDQAHQNGRRWLVTASSNFDLGVGEPRDLSDAFVAYAKTRGEYLQALYAYVFGLQQLAHASGLDVEEVRRLVPPDARPKPGRGEGGTR